MNVKQMVTCHSDKNHLRMRGFFNVPGPVRYVVVLLGMGDSIGFMLFKRCDRAKWYMLWHINAIRQLV
jgi:hypothetical protein